MHLSRSRMGPLKAVSRWGVRMKEAGINRKRRL
jgi:hypothetical protein